MPGSDSTFGEGARRDSLDKLAERVAAAVRAGELEAARAMLREAAARPTQTARPAPADLAPPPAVPPRFMLWVDGVGSYLVLTKPAVTVGRWSESEAPDLPLAANVSRRHARIQRFEGDWFLSAWKPTRVNGRPVESALLTDGDEVVFGEGPAAAFRQPTRLSATGVLAFASACLPVRDARCAVLMAERLILSPDGAGHITNEHADARVVLFWADDGLRCQVEGNVLLNGRGRRAPCPVRVGDRIETRGWSFSLTGDAV